jgi:hypothetical protein
VAFSHRAAPFPATLSLLLERCVHRIPSFLFLLRITLSFLFFSSIFLQIDSNTLRSHEEKQYGGEASSDAGSEGDAAVRGPDEGSVRPSPLLPGADSNVGPQEDRLEEYAGPTFGFFDEDLAVWDYGVAEEVRADYREDVLPPPLKLGASQFGHRSLFGDQAYGGGAQVLASVCVCVYKCVCVCVLLQQCTTMLSLGGGARGEYG